MKSSRPQKTLPDKTLAIKEIPLRDRVRIVRTKAKEVFKIMLLIRDKLQFRRRAKRRRPSSKKAHSSLVRPQSSFLQASNLSRLRFNPQIQISTSCLRNSKLINQL